MPYIAGSGPFQPHILLVEDEPSIAKGLQMVMNERGYEVDLALTGRDALDTFWASDYDLVVADLRLPDIDGMKVVEEVKEKRPDTKVVIITGYPSVPSAVQAVKMGVSDYLPKPFTDDEFKLALEGALQDKLDESMKSLIAEAEQERLIQKQEVVRVLDRTSRDAAFWRGLMERGSETLADYQLSSEAKAALVSGDLRWIRDNIGEMTLEQLMFIYKRLEREAW